MGRYVVFDDDRRKAYSDSLGFDAAAAVEFDLLAMNLQDYRPLFREMLVWINNCSGDVHKYADMFVFSDPDEAFMFHLAFSHV